MGQYKYIFEVVVADYDNLENQQVGLTDNQKYRLVLDSYKEQHGYNQQGVSDLLQGLWLGFDYLYVDIDKRLLSWGVKPTFKNVANWWQVLAYKMLQINKVLDNNIKLEKLLSK